MIKVNGGEHDDKRNEAKLDSEWVNLILEARQLGLTIIDVRNFLKGVRANTLKS